MAIAEVAADHQREPVGLALEGQRRALDLLVVLELDLEEPDHLDRDAGRPGDADTGVVVGVEHLLDVALGDVVAHRGAAVAGHHDAARERQRDDRGAVRCLGGQGRGRGRSSAGKQLGGVAAEELGERRAAGREVGGRQSSRAGLVGGQRFPLSGARTDEPDPSTGAGPS